MVFFVLSKIVHNNSFQKQEPNKPLVSRHPDKVIGFVILLLFVWFLAILIF